ncbi:MAG: glycosyltransferase [Gemmatimonadales bacterium]
MTPSLRVVQVASGREWRGGQRQVLLLARDLARRGIDQVVVTTAGSRLAKELGQAGVAVRAAPWHRAFSLRTLGMVAGLARRPGTILHAHDAHALVLAGIAARLFGCPLVVTRRVDFHIRRPGFWVRADRVIAISEAVAEILRADGIPPERIALVHSGIDLEGTRATVPGTIRTELGLPAGGLLAVTVAALAPHKDHVTLLHAAAALRPTLPGLHWALAGEGTERATLTALAEQLGVADVVHFLGQVREPLRLIKAGSVFVLSSREEGLGTSILDAMVLGVPVVATAAGGIPEMLGGGGGVLVPPGDPAALADAVAKLLRDPARARALVDRAAAKVTDFSAAAMAEGALSVYRSLLLER